MNPLKEFLIQFQGLKNGIHQFEYQINSKFFKNFEDSALHDVDIEVQLEMDRQTNMLVLDFEFEGTMKAECDRCLEQIDMPIDGELRLMIKFSEEEKEEEDDVVYIHPESPGLNVAKFIYEAIHLGIPFRKVKPECDDTPEECPTNLMSFWNNEEEDLDSTIKKDEIPKESIWNELNKLKK